MPFTPFHVGPAIPVKAAMDKKFSLLTYAWAQVVMDLQPLIVILTRRGRTHGITHTFVGCGCAGRSRCGQWEISWRVDPEFAVLWKAAQNRHPLAGGDPERVCGEFQPRPAGRADLPGHVAILAVHRCEPAAVWRDFISDDGFLRGQRSPGAGGVGRDCAE